MEHKTHDTAHQQCKSLKNILYVWDGISQNQNRATNKMGGFAVEEMGKLNIFLVQNKGKGPPGRQRSPGYYADHPPDGSDGSDDGHPPDRCEPLNCLSSVFPERSTELTPKSVEGEC
jgi:hypothetical protein